MFLSYHQGVSMVEPPDYLSAEAQEHLRNPPEPPPVFDARQPEVARGFRDAAHREWIALNDEIAGRWVHRDEVWGGVPAVRFAAGEEALDGEQILVHLHGGSFVVGTPLTNAEVIVPVTRRTGLPVVSIDYRLAPEHRCPAAIDDAVAAYRALREEHDVVGLYGESAGGGLALATAIALRDLGRQLPNRLGLLSPWVDLTCSGDTYRTLVHVDPDFPHPEVPPNFAEAYAGGDTGDPMASPLFADLSGLPTTLIQVGGREILLSDSCRLDQALRAAGVESTLDIWDGLWHVWQLHPHVPEAGTALTELADFLVAGNR